jgi:hypothetical protein
LLKPTQFQSHFQQENSGEPHFSHYFRPSPAFQNRKPIFNARSPSTGSGSLEPAKTQRKKRMKEKSKSFDFELQLILLSAFSAPLREIRKGILTQSPQRRRE